MSIAGIHGLPLEVTVVGCYNLEDKEWVSRQDPFVCLEYGSARFRTKTCTATLSLPMILSAAEGKSHSDDLIETNKLPVVSSLIQLLPTLQDSTPQSSFPRHSGEVRLILHYPNAKQPQNWKAKGVPSLPEYAPCAPFKQLSPYAHPPAAPYLITMPYAAPPSSYNLYTHSTATYPPSPYVGYPPQAPPASYTYPHHAYPPPPLPSTYYPPAPTGIYLPAPY
ncbi:hypothetical protein V6N11_003544 [Hibiscus sabdariffa]|uniref:C2 domain-containing protein n=1 Tax=Hibiscus sabdariffa TaxID=183260 RepID=A0ABR2SDU2_9ROSI